MSDDQLQDIYAPPKATLEKPMEVDSRILAFPRFSTWAVLGLTIITLSFYVLYWLYSRTKILNRIMPERSISSWLVWVVIVFYIGGMVMSFAVEFIPISPNLLIAGGVMSIASTIGTLIWVYKFRNRINLLTGESRGSKYWLGAFLTFFLQTLYLAFKVNQHIDRAKENNPQ